MTVRPIRALGGVPLRFDCALVSGALFVARVGVNRIAILEHVSTSEVVLFNAAHDGL